MAGQLIWSPSARLDLKDLYLFIKDKDAPAAARFVEKILSSVERLIQFPESGRVVPEFSDPHIREVICPPCRIVYRLKKSDGVVEIARVWYAARGIPEV